MRKIFIEREARLSICKKQAPGITVNDLAILKKILFKNGYILVASDLDSLQLSSPLTISWHLLGRSIDLC
ncbi:hypothetical protein THRCLA_23456 [Thraustotheca clavata]|uniref:Uncharacterized protein n=1 Tax=Thraustotheca clavata TaxID=74557 RepID=A0A1V9Y4C9_9STRA|nr:hypothetical protein THRCLA_23456 [Thraustotheca clavata]